MSVRTEPKEMSPQMQQALMVPEHVLRQAQAQSQDGGMTAAPVDPAMNDQHLAAANDFNNSNPDHPLKRTVVVNIRASLNDLCLKKSRATWSPPSAEATKAIFQQKKFTDLQGTAAHLQDIPHARGRVAVGKHQHVGGPLEARMRKDALAELRVQRRIRMHLSLIGEVRLAKRQLMQRLTHASP